MYSPLLVADYILAKRHAPLNPLQANKIVYIAHGFTLAIYDTKLVYEPVEAWKYGPVFPSLYYTLRRYGGNDIPHLSYCNTKLSDIGINERLDFFGKILGNRTKVIDMVMDTYGTLTGNRLITITHKKGTPWHKFYRKNRHDITIPTEEIKIHYQEIKDGRS